MKISWIKSLYLWLVRIISLLNFRKTRNNVAYVMSFDNNMNLIFKIAETIPAGHKLIVFYTRINSNRKVLEKLRANNVLTIHFNEGLRFVFKVLPILLTSKLIICDNYYPFLGGLKLPRTVKVLQIWHADGAVKKFGWGDPATKLRSNSDQQRFQKVYDRFDQYIVASKAMGRVFAHDYHVPFSRMRLLGYPRSDRFFDPRWLQKSREQVLKRYPRLKGHRVILYAPTYRKGVTFDPPRGLIKALTSDSHAVVVVRLHPALRARFYQIESRMGEASRLYYLNQASTAKLLTVTNTLVTDYSSVAFDYSLLPTAHSMIFFTYDLTDYKQVPGCQPDFLKWLPDHPVTTVNQLAEVIRKNRPTNFKSFNSLWNTYNDGHASERFIKDYIKPLRRRN